MTYIMENCHVTHHGWLNEDRYICERLLDSHQLVEITASQHLISKRFSQKAIDHLIATIDFEKHKIILLPFIAQHSNIFFGVEKIERIFSQVLIKVVQFKSLEQTDFGSSGQYLVISVPKNMKDEIIIFTEYLNIKEEPEFKDVVIEESFVRLKLDMCSSDPEIDSCLYADDIHNEQEIKQKNWFRILPSHKKIDVLKQFQIQQELKQVEKKEQKAFQLLSKRLLGKYLEDD